MNELTHRKKDYLHRVWVSACGGLNSVGKVYIINPQPRWGDDNRVGDFFPFPLEDDEVTYEFLPCPRIVIYRELPIRKSTNEVDGFVKTSDDPVREAVIIAHEFGHFRSLCREHGDNPKLWGDDARRDAQALLDRYNRLRYDEAKSDDHSTIMDEERRAWELGRQLLEGLGQEDLWLEVFESRRKEALDGYARALPSNL